MTSQFSEFSSSVRLTRMTRRCLAVAVLMIIGLFLIPSPAQAQINCTISEGTSVDWTSTGCVPGSGSINNGVFVRNQVINASPPAITVVPASQGQSVFVGAFSCTGPGCSLIMFNSNGSVFFTSNSSTVFTPAEFELTLNYNNVNSDAVTIVLTKSAGSNDLTGLASGGTFVADTTAPDAPTGLDLAAASDTGSSNSDNITNDTSSTLTGSAEADSTVALTSSLDGMVGSATATGGNWSITTSALSQGVHSITATATDASGNASGASTALVITVDTTAPAMPSKPDLIAASDTGPVSFDNQTNDTTPTFTGTAEAGSTVTLNARVGATNVATVSGLANGSGAWTLTPTIGVEGAVGMIATATDAAGNESATSFQQVTFDTTAPRIASITRKTPSVETTNADELVFNILFNDNMARPGLAASDFIVTGTTATLQVGGDFYSPQFTLTLSGGDLASLVGPVSLSIAPGQTIVDRAGNALTNVALINANESYAVVQTPGPPTNLSLVSHVNPSPTDAANTQANISWTQSTAPNGSAITVQRLDVYSDVACTTSVFNASLGAALNSLPLELALSSLPVGSKPSVSIRAVNAAGESVNSNCLTLTIPSSDVTPPTVTITSTAANPISGAFDVSLTFSETVTGLTVGDLTVSNGAASNLRTSPSSTLYFATITPAGDGPVTVNMAAEAVQDLAGNANIAASQFSITNDGTAPTVTLSTSATETVRAAFPITVTFSEAVTGFIAGDIAVVNGSLSNFATTSASVYTATVTPTADGSVTIDVPSSAVLDGAGNNNSAATQLVRTADLTAPTIVSITRGFLQTGGQIPVTTDADVISWFVKFSEDITRPDPSDFTATGTSSSISISHVNDDEYEISIANGDIQTVNGTVTLSFASGQTITDTVGNPLSVGVPSGANDNFFTMVNDAVAPTLSGLSMVSSNSRPEFAKDGDIITMAFAASEALQTPTVTIAGQAATVSNMGNNYTARITVGSSTPEGQAAYSITYSDLAGNAGVTVTNITNFTFQLVDIDVTTPILTEVTAVSTPTQDNTPDVVLGFNEGGDLVMSGAGCVLPSPVARSPGSHTITFDTLRDDVYACTAVLTDLAGNSSAPLTLTTFVVDTTAPDTPTSLDLVAASDSGVSDSDNITNVRQPTFTVTVPADAVTVQFFANGTMIGRSVPTTTTVTYMSYTTLADGDYSITATSIDSLGNESPASDGLSITIDGTAPTASTVDLFSGVVSPTDADVVSWGVTFSEDLDTTSISGDDFVSTGTTATPTVSRVSENVFEVSLANGDMANLNATVTLALASGATIADKAGNSLTNLSVTGSNNNAIIVQNDVEAPTLVIASSEADLVSGVFTASFTFSEDVTGFDVADIALVNATSSAVSATNASVYTALITPNANGLVTLNVAAGAANDGAGNSSDAAAEFSITNDATAPTVVIVSTSTDPVSGAFPITVTFSETVTGFTAEDLSVGNGTTRNFAATSGSIYTATIMPASDGLVTVNVAAAVAQDGARNANAAATQFSITNDGSLPTVVIASTSTDLVSGTFPVSVTFSEDVRGFVIGDLTIGNGTAREFVAASASVYTAVIAPQADGAVTIDIAAAVVSDLAGNSNVEAAQFSIANDQTPPTVTASTPPPSVNGPFDLTFSFTEDVTGLTADDFAVTNATVTVTGGPRDFTVTVTPDGIGDVTVSLPANAALDAAGNGNAAFDTTIDVDFDATLPTLSLTTESSEVTGAFTVTATFSESVTGFALDDFGVENGTVSDFSGSETAYKVMVTPTTLGAVTVSVPEGAAEDGAANLSVASVVTVTATSGDVVVELDVGSTVLDPTNVGTEFTLSNPGTRPLSFIASVDQPWVDVSPETGQIGSLSDLEFSITLNDNIDRLEPGTYVATVTVEIDDATVSSATGSSLKSQANSQAISSNVLAQVPVTVNVEERFGDFELIVLTPDGPSDTASFAYSSDIASVNGLIVQADAREQRVRVERLLQGVYTIEQVTPDGWTLDNISCQGDLDDATVVNLEAGQVSLDLDPSESLSCTFENIRDDDAIRIATQRAIRNFMARRGDRVLQAAPDLANRFTERGQSQGGEFIASGSDLRTSMNFQTSVSGFRNRASDNAVGPSSDFTHKASNKWDLWASAEYARYEDQRADSGIDGKFFAAQFGADYLVKSNLILGAMVQYDWMEETDKALAQGVGAIAGAEVSGDGIMAGPYLVWKAKDKLTIDLMGLWGGSDNQVNPLGYYSDDFKTDRYMVRANVTGEFDYGRWRMRPQVSLSHYEDKQDAYVDRLGINIPSQTVTIGRLRAGPELVWTHKEDNGDRLELGGSIRAVWNYNGPGLQNASGRISSGGDPVRADASLLLGLKMANGLRLRGKAGFDGINQGDFTARSGRLEIVIPFGGNSRAGTEVDRTELGLAGFRRACETEAYLQSFNVSASPACGGERRATLLDTNIGLMTPQ